MTVVDAAGLALGGAEDNAWDTIAESGRDPRNEPVEFADIIACGLEEWSYAVARDHNLDPVAVYNEARRLSAQKVY